MAINNNLIAIVTGAQGFVGSGLVNSFFLDKIPVYAIGKDEQKLPVELIAENIKDVSIKDLKKICEGKEAVVFHQAANSNTLDESEESHMYTNCDDSLEFFVKCQKSKIKKFVYASSTAVYGNSPAPYLEDKTELKPENAYARSKRAFEGHIKKFLKVDDKLVVVGLRYCNVYGSGEDHKVNMKYKANEKIETANMSSMVRQIIVQALESKDEKIRLLTGYGEYGPGEQKRDFINIYDIITLNYLAAQATESNIFNAGSGTATTFNKLADVVNKALVSQGLIEKPREIEYVSFESLSINPKKYQSYTECDMTKAKNILSFEPEFDIEKGVRRYIADCFTSSAS